MLSEKVLGSPGEEGIVFGRSKTSTNMSETLLLLGNVYRRLDTTSSQDTTSPQSSERARRRESMSRWVGSNSD